jgi:hypothetical protein
MEPLMSSGDIFPNISAFEFKNIFEQRKRRTIQIQIRFNLPAEFKSHQEAHLLKVISEHLLYSFPDMSVHGRFF